MPETRPAGRLLALDVSSVCCGWSVWQDGHLVTFGRFRQQGKDHGEKLAHFQAWLQDLLTEHTPDIVAYEAPYAGRRRHTFAVLTMYCGIVLLAHFAYFGYECPKSHRIAAHLVKKQLKVRKGRSHTENKKIVVLWANETFGLSLKFAAEDKRKVRSQDDEADAIAVGFAWYCLHA